ncbi:twin-arginine translocase TatA/TatE family subunit [Desulforamulus ruminis]|uniref:Sec-independent protein translocase protein TatA n=1 Tax=Desulforamulus ruminis (strain ATCC 23193 / DSM 2154 / NCIMB 8452 / DL) TaxID=696281 RepID=F6DR49_DESRL|nr:twin-arginine translocase TatA/TatE family subunit [Desulforamulus ruminis]AEG59768.1 sec-independent translocation protein mttA/Hcf106 [Desulforamulus ruminis DSM 2154]
MYGMFQPSHLILILIVVLIIFGPGKMKGLGKSLGESLRDFKTEMNKTGEDKEEKAENNTESKS